MCSSLPLSSEMVHAGVILRSDDVWSETTYMGTSAIVVTDKRSLLSPRELVSAVAGAED